MTPRDGKLVQDKFILLAYLTALEKFVDAKCSASVESFRWQVWTEEEGHKDLSRGFASSFKRAVENLAERQRLSVVKRRLKSIDECIQHFPGKTRDIAVKELRDELLPALQRCLGDSDFRLRFARRDYELFHYERLSASQKRRVEKAWRTIEPDLINELRDQVNPGNRDCIFWLFTKCKMLFEGARGELPLALQGYLNNCKSIIAEALFQRINRLYQSFLPQDVLGNLVVRNFVHTFADVPQHRRCMLKEETIDLLDQTCSEIVRKLPQYQESDRVHNRFRTQNHDPVLHKLLDHTVFQEFLFVNTVSADP